MSSARDLPRSFEALIGGAERPVLVDFYATWCAPCKVVAPVVQQMAKTYKGRLLTVKVDIDKKPHIAQKYRVSAVPTLMLFAGGSPVLTVQGARSFEELSRAIEPHLPASAGN